MLTIAFGYDFFLIFYIVKFLHPIFLLSPLLQIQFCPAGSILQIEPIEPIPLGLEPVILDRSEPCPAILGAGCKPAPAERQIIQAIVEIAEASSGGGSRFETCSCSHFPTGSKLISHGETIFYALS
ncbi:MAG: hypothetical protein HY879_09015 [Deltaproteobacteria bacterium]|nr:hypothetical protein [Deltaproteobacteria bacterium]